jgi:hypothetical protein
LVLNRSSIYYTKYYQLLHILHKLHRDDYKLTTIITKYFWIYLHPEVVVIIAAALHVGAPVTFGGAWIWWRRGVVAVVAEEHAMMRLANSFSSEVSSWFTNVSSEETSSASSSGSSSDSSSISSSDESEESSSPPPSSKGHNLFLAFVEEERGREWQVERTREPLAVSTFIADVGAYSRRCLDHGA